MISCQIIITFIARECLYLHRFLTVFFFSVEFLVELDVTSTGLFCICAWFLFPVFMPSFLLEALVSDHPLLFYHMVTYKGPFSQATSSHGSHFSEFLRWSLMRALTVIQSVAEWLTASNF